MEFVGKAGESGGGMYVVSILFHLEDLYEEILFTQPLGHLTGESQNMDIFLYSCPRSAQSAGQSGSRHA